MKMPDELRMEFWKKDQENGGLIFNQYQEIKRVLHEQDIEWVEKQYAAINNTEFYREYSIDDQFPVMSKMQMLDDYNKHIVKSGYLQPTHVSSTSGSTGTPFAVIQDLKKRKRTIADLKVFGELCNYPSHERMAFFRVLNDKLCRTPEIEERENIYYIDSSDLGVTHLGEMVDAILRKRPLKLNIDKKVDEDLLKNKFLSVLGEGAVIDVEYVDEIPVLSSNKRRAVICEWKKS